MYSISKSKCIFIQSFFFAIFCGFAGCFSSAESFFPFALLWPITCSARLRYLKKGELPVWGMFAFCSLFYFGYNRLILPSFSSTILSSINRSMDLCPMASPVTFTRLKPSSRSAALIRSSAVCDSCWAST